MRSPVAKRSISIAGRKTSVTLEDVFWSAAKEIAALKNVSVSELVEQIHNGSRAGNLSSAVRLFVLDYYRALATKNAQ